MEMLYFGAIWCLPCRQMQPVLARLTDINIRRYDFDNDNALARQYGVTAVPTMILSNGRRLIGYHTEAQIRAAFQS